MGITNDPSKNNYVLQWQPQVALFSMALQISGRQSSENRLSNALSDVWFLPLFPNGVGGVLVWESAANSALAVRHGDDHPSFSLVNNPAIVITREFSKTSVLPRGKKRLTGKCVYTPNADAQSPCLLKNDDRSTCMGSRQWFWSQYHSRHIFTMGYTFAKGTVQHIWMIQSF